MAISVSFPFSWAAQPGSSGSASLGTGFLYRILSPTRLIPNCSIGGLRAPPAGCWLSLLHLVSNWSGFQTNWLPVFTKLYNSSTSTFLWTSQSHSFNPSTVKVIFWYSLFFKISHVKFFFTFVSITLTHILQNNSSGQW